jgi:hypothetical protein
MGTSFIPARAANQTAMIKATVGRNPRNILSVKLVTASFSPPADEYTIHKASGAANGMVAVIAAKNLLCFSITATRTMTIIDRTAGKNSCIFILYSPENFLGIIKSPHKFLYGRII